MSIDLFLLNIGDLLNHEVPIKRGHVSVLVLLIVLIVGYLIAQSTKEALSRNKRTQEQATDGLASNKLLRATAVIEAPATPVRKVSGEISQPSPGSYRLVIEDTLSLSGSPKVSEFSTMLSLEQHLEQFTPLRLGDFK